MTRPAIRSPARSLTFEVRRHKGWSHEQPALRDISFKEAPKSPDEVARLKVVRYADGAYVFESERYTGWVQFYWPRHKKEAGRYYRDYAAQIRVTAPEHDGLALEYAGERPPLPGWSEAAGGGKAEYDVNGVLWFRLRSQTAVSLSN